MNHLVSVAAFLSLSVAAFSQDSQVVPYSEQHVSAIYVSGYVTDYARVAGVDDWTYVGRMLDKIRAMGFTTVHPNNLVAEDLPRWLEMAEARGLRLIYQGGVPMRDYYIWDPNERALGDPWNPQERRRRCREEMIPWYRDTLVPRHRSNRALLGYCLTEEVQIEEDPTIWEDLRDVTAAARAVDALHPAFVEHLWAEQVERSLPIQRPEVVLYGPGTVDDGPWNQYLDWFEVWVDQAARACRRQGTTYYAVLTSVDTLHQQEDRWVPTVWQPTREDYILQAWLAYANGAQGLDFWWYHTIDENVDGSIIRFRGVEDEFGRRTAMFDTMVEMNRQIAPLAGYLRRLQVVEGNGGLPYDREESWVRMRLLRMPDSGDAYLLAVNKNTSQAERIDFDLSSILPVGAQVRTVPDGAVVDPRTLSVPPGQGVLLRLGRLRSDLGRSRIWAGAGPNGGGLVHRFDTGGLWRTFPWTQYNLTQGEVRPALGDVDGDGRDEILLGMGAYRQNGGFIAVMDDDAGGNRLLRWLRVPWTQYDVLNGETHVACGNLDADPLDEVVLGLGTGGQGRWLAMDDAARGHAVLGWGAVPWSTYQGQGGETHPACGDLDGDGRAEVVVGLGRWGQGRLAVFEDLGAGMAFRRWILVGALAATSTWPACGNLDRDARAEVVVGEGPGGGGRFAVFDDLPSGCALVRRERVGWPAYEFRSGEVRPACGDVDGSPGDEVVLGLGRTGEGRVQVRGRGAAWLQVPANPRFRSTGETWPAVGRSGS